MVDDVEVYRVARGIVRGEGRIDPLFDDFVRGFADAFGVAPLALLSDHVDAGHGQVDPRLWVVIERADDVRQFVRDEPIEKVIERHRMLTDLFALTVPTDDLASRFGLPKRQTWASSASRLFVVVRDFESAAIEAAHRQVSAGAVDAFAAGLGLGEQFSCTRRWEPWPPVVFVHTDAQAQALREAGEPQRWSQRYADLVRGFDEFGYVRPEDVTIKVDSEETFQRDYQGSSYYYF